MAHWLFQLCHHQEKFTIVFSTQKVQYYQVDTASSWVEELYHPTMESSVQIPADSLTCPLDKLDPQTHYYIFVLIFTFNTLLNHPIYPHPSQHHLHHQVWICA